jgi:hypothetical protein
MTKHDPKGLNFENGGRLWYIFLGNSGATNSQITKQHKKMQSAKIQTFNVPQTKIHRTPTTLIDTINCTFSVATQFKIKN